MDGSRAYSCTSQICRSVRLQFANNGSHAPWTRSRMPRSSDPHTSIDFIPQDCTVFRSHCPSRVGMDLRQILSPLLVMEERPNVDCAVGGCHSISPRLEPPPRFDKPGATLRHEIMGRLLFVCTSKAGPSRRFCDFNAELTWD